MKWRIEVNNETFSKGTVTFGGGTDFMPGTAGFGTGKSEGKESYSKEQLRDICPRGGREESETYYDGESFSE